jgi:hypothetical protein
MTWFNRRKKVLHKRASLRIILPFHHRQAMLSLAAIMADRNTSLSFFLVAFQGCDISLLVGIAIHDNKTFRSSGEPIHQHAPNCGALTH